VQLRWGRLGGTGVVWACVRCCLGVWVCTKLALRGGHGGGSAAQVRDSMLSWHCCVCTGSVSAVVLLCVSVCSRHSKWPCRTMCSIHNNAAATDAITTPDNCNPVFHAPQVLNAPGAAQALLIAHITLLLLLLSQPTLK
jgi:hypothetical protein